MWALERRTRLDRRGSRYPSDLTDAEWALVAPLIPPAKRGGNKRSVDMRGVVDGLLYVLTTGSQWRALPKDLAPRSTVHGYFDQWEQDGTLERIYRALILDSREPAVAPAQAASGESRNVKNAETSARRASHAVPLPTRRAKSKLRQVRAQAQRLSAHVLPFLVAALSKADPDRWPLESLGL